jgi:hypothetical protein
MRSLRWACAITVAASVATVAWVGCGGDAFTTGGGPDSGTIDSAVEASDAPIDVSSDSIGPLGKVIFVSASGGDDTRPGTDPLRPVKTIAVGVLRAANLNVTGAEVHVCEGTYPENGLTIKGNVALLGGYACATWMRTSTYGYPSFDMKHQAIITAPSASAVPPTLVVQGASVTSATVIDGFSIVGALSPAGQSYGLDIQGGASPTVTNNQISGGGGKPSGANFGSIGIHIGDSSNAELAFCEVSGGAGEAPIGSVGIWLSSTGTPSVHDDLVSGGVGTTSGAPPSLGSVGVAIAAALTMPLSNLKVSGTDPAGSTAASRGVYITNSSTTATINGCSITGGSGMGASSMGVDIESAGAVTLVDNRIYGGARTSAGETIGVLAANVMGTLTVQDSEIHAGNPVGGNSPAVGIQVQGTGSSSTANIAESTIYTGSSPNAVGLKFGNPVSGVALSGNILVGGGEASSDVAVETVGCGGVFSLLNKSVFMNFASAYMCSGSGGGPSMTAPDPGVLDLDLGATVAFDNYQLQTSCSGAQTWCLADAACPSTTSENLALCVQSLFGPSWTSLDDGVTGLFGPPGFDGGATLSAWTLAPGIPCPVANGGSAVTGQGNDLLGIPRGNEPSMGATQYASAQKCH